MCGIVGLYLKNPQLESRLGELFEPMLIAMTDRGPDSAGFAVYGDEYDDGVKLTLERHSRRPNGVKLALARRFGPPDGVKLTLERRSRRPNGVKLALDWRFGQADGVKLALERRFGCLGSLARPYPLRSPRH